jgi:hypothetical protein
VETGLITRSFCQRVMPYARFCREGRYGWQTWREGRFTTSNGVEHTATLSSAGRVPIVVVVTAERRLGERIAVDGVTVAWLVEWRGRLGRHRLRAEVGRIVDISISGARIEAPWSRDLTVGNHVVLGMGEARALAEIRRIEPDEEHGTARYGVAFVTSDPEFQQFIVGRLDAHRGDVRWRWQAPG